MKGLFGEMVRRGAEVDRLQARIDRLRFAAASGWTLFVLAVFVLILMFAGQK